MPVKTGRKLPRARVDAKVAQAAVEKAMLICICPLDPIMYCEMLIPIRF